MTTFITLIRYTQQGVKNMQDNPIRLDRARKALEAAGGELKGFYLTMGQYDAVVIGDVPNDKEYMKTIMTMAAAGTVRTETLRAFTEEESREIISELP